MDKLIRALGANGEWIATAIEATSAIEEARKLRHYEGEALIKLGRVILLTAMMASMLKGERDDLSISLQTGDSKTRFIATANAKIELKATAILSAESTSPYGTMTVVKDLGLKTPYTSTTRANLDDLESSFDFYFVQSEQILTKTKTYVELNDDGSVKQAFAYMVQSLPNANQQTAEAVLENFKNMPTVESLSFHRESLADILARLFAGLGESQSEEKPVAWHCSCSKERGANILKSLGADELGKMIAEGKTIDIACGFCGKTYYYTVDELEAIRLQINLFHSA